MPRAIFSQRWESVLEPWVPTQKKYVVFYEFRKKTTGATKNSTLWFTGFFNYKSFSPDFPLCVTP